MWQLFNWVLYCSVNDPYRGKCIDHGWFQLFILELFFAEFSVTYIVLLGNKAIIVAKVYSTSDISNIFVFKNEYYVRWLHYLAAISYCSVPTFYLNWRRNEKLQTKQHIPFFAQYNYSVSHTDIENNIYWSKIVKTTYDYFLFFNVCLSYFIIFKISICR